MLTCWMVTAGFMLVLGVGGFIFEKAGINNVIDALTSELPMYWADIKAPDKQGCTPADLD